MGQSYVIDVQRLEAHQFGGHGVNGHLVGRGQDDVLDLRLHGARAGAVARGGAIHRGEDAGIALPISYLSGDEIVPFKIPLSRP